MENGLNQPFFKERFSVNVVLAHRCGFPSKISTLCDQQSRVMQLGKISPIWKAYTQKIKINWWQKCVCISFTDGSDWKRYGLSSSQPAMSKDTPNGRTPLQHENNKNNFEADVNFHRF